MESICASVAFPAWGLGRDPTKNLTCVSYGRDLVRKQALDFRTITNEQWHHDLFPDLGMKRKRQHDTEIITAANSYRFASVLGGGVLGRSADIIIVMQRLHEGDLVGHVLEKEE